MTEKMLQFINLDKKNPDKREVLDRKGDFNEIYKEFINENPEIHEIALADYLVREIATERCRFYLGSQNPIEPEEVMKRLGDLSDEELLDWMTSGLKFSPESPGNHINWWTHEKIEKLAKKVGFQTTYFSGRGQSLCRPMTNLGFFDSKVPHNSLYFEAIR